MLITVGHRGILAEFLVRLVVSIHEIPPASVKPGLRRLDSEMVVALAGQFALSAGALQDPLGQCDGCGNAVFPHLFHRRLGVFVYVVARFAHRSSDGNGVQSG